jgi:NADH-quinone oxidoreductase subunit J
MTVQLVVFYMLAAVTVAAGILVVSARNPVLSVLFLILAFFNCAGLFVLIGAEFLAMVLVVVYVGAVAVLFLFVVMMLDIDFATLRSGFTANLPFGILIALVLLAEIVVAVSAWEAGPALSGREIPSSAQPNIVALGQLLYSRYLFPFEIAGLILLVAMVGAIVLTLRSRGDTRTPRSRRQLRASPAKAIRNMDPAVGEGMKL